VALEATAAAGLSTAVGDDAAAASASALRGEPTAVFEGSIDGELVACARAIPPRASWLAGLTASAASEG
jgi:hypothetical protein